MSPKRSGTGKYYLMTLAAVVFWSFTGPLIKLISVRYPVPPFQLAAWRDLLTGIIVLAALLLFKPSLLKIARKQVPFILAYSLLLSIFNISWTFSVYLNGAAVSTVLIYSSAPFTVILGYLVLRESVNWAKIVASILSLIGCVFVSGAHSAETWQGNPLGIIIGISSGLLFAIYALFGRSAAHRGISSWGATALTFTLGSIPLFILNQTVLSVFGFTTGNGSLLPSMDLVGWLIMLLLVIGPTIGGFGLYNLALQHLPGSIVNLIVPIGPLFATVESYLILGERLTPIQLLGGVFIIGGLIILRLYESRREKLESAKHDAIAENPTP